MICPQCGEKNNAAAVNCSACGKWLPLPDRNGESGSAIPMIPPRPQQTAMRPDISLEPAPPPVQEAVPGWSAPQPPGVPISGLSPLTPSALRSPLPAYGSLSTALPTNQAFLCRVCGASLYPGQRRCLRCQTPPGFIVNPNDPTATTFLPFGMPVPLVSVLRAASVQVTNGHSEELGGWNWAAALIPVAWAARHRVAWMSWLSGLVTVLLISLLLSSAALHQKDTKGTLTGFLIVSLLIFWLPLTLFAGRRGNTLAWRSGLYADKEILRKSQRSWALWAIIGVTIVIFLLAVAFILLRAT